MATLTSLSTIMPGVTSAAGRLAESPTTLEQIRLKRMAREEQDRKNAESASAIALNKAKTGTELSAEEANKEWAQIVANAPPINWDDQYQADGDIRRWAAYMLSTGNPIAIDKANDSIEQLNNFIKGGPVADTSTLTGAGEAQDIARSQAEQEKLRQEGLAFAAGADERQPVKLTATQLEVVKGALADTGVTGVLGPDPRQVSQVAEAALQRFNDARRVNQLDNRTYEDFVKEEISIRYNKDPELGGQNLNVDPETNLPVYRFR